MARVALSFDNWKVGEVRPATLEVKVVASQPRPVLEPVSGRLQRELNHPNNTGLLAGLHFSPDGRRLIAGDYPGGVVVVWDVATGRALTSIETGRGYRGANYVSLSPDWQTLFVSKEGRNYEQIEQDGKKLIRWQFDGSVRAWDVASGRLLKTFQHQPARNVLAMELSPDGTHFVTFEELPGTYEGSAKRAASLWDAKTGEYRPMPDGLQSLARFSPDGRSLAISTVDEKGITQAVKLFDTETGQEKASIPIAEENAWVYATGFSPDSRLMVGDYRVYEVAGKYDKARAWLKWWDTTAGREVASIPGGPNDSFYNPRFSPDGQFLAFTNGTGEHGRLLLFSVADKRLTKTITLVTKGKSENLSVGEPIFSPDGKRLAVITQAIPTSPRNTEVDARDCPQPRIHLVDLATGEIRETLISPPGFPRSACFSPDGRTLATGGQGKALLWDLSEGLSRARE